MRHDPNNGRAAVLCTARNTGERTMREGSREWSEAVSLSPAVLKVDGTRIRYTGQFRAHLLRELLEGHGPTDIFRKAGLPPELIGRKRIEHCANRTRKSSRVMALLERVGDTWSNDAPEDADPALGDDRSERTPAWADDPWRMLVSMSHRINYLDERVQELERLVAGTPQPGANRPDIDGVGNRRTGTSASGA